MSRVEASPEGRPATEIAVQLVDCDVHPTFSSRDEALEYVPEPWRSRDAQRFAYGGSQNSYIYTPAGARGDALRYDAVPPSGGPPGSDPAFLREQLIDRGRVDLAILIPLTARPRANAEHEAAGCRATNLWLDDVWLTKNNADGIFRGALSVCLTDPRLAVEEIEYWAGNPNFVEVYVRPPAPAGQPTFWPVYEAADRHGLAVALHPIRNPGMGLLTPAGFSSYYLEIHPAWALVVAPHLVSLLMSGVLERFPGLRIAAKEFGVSWVAPFLWRLDRIWAAQKSEVPWVKKPPSEYFREHVRLTTQPWEESPVSAQLEAALDWVSAGETLMFSSDYPHHDADDPSWIVPQLPARYRDRVLAQTALEFYGLPRTRRAPTSAQ